MKVQEIMIEEMDTITEDGTLEDVRRKYAEGESGSLLVEKEGDVVGIVTTWDALEAIGDDEDLNDVKISDAMETHLVTIPSDASVEQAAKEMVDHGIWRLLVEDHGEIVGVVSATDILEMR